MRLLDRPEYGFLTTAPHLGENIIFLTYGGSHAYGTNTEGSDIDIRGCTLREKDHDLLMDIRNGRYQKADHTFIADFYDLLNELERRLDYAAKHTSLPEVPDLAEIEAFQMEVNERVVRGEV